MNFAFTEEQEELRSTIRAFMEAKSSEEAVREQMETDQGYDPEVWTQMAEQMGLQGLAIPEEYGGSGFSFIELGIVLEEMGRALLCAPFFSSVVLGANTLLQSGDDAAKAEHLPKIAMGETIATVAMTEENGRWDEDGIEMQASGSGSDVTLSGTKSFVIDGHVANLFIVAAKSPAGTSLYLVDGDASGITRTQLSTMDQTRKQAKVEFDNTPAKLLGTEGEGWNVLNTVLDLVAVGLAVHPVGGVRRSRRMDGDLAVDLRSQRCRHGGQSCGLVGVQGVAAARRHDLRGETGAIGRERLERPIGMPGLCKQWSLLIGQPMDRCDVLTAVDCLEERIVPERAEVQREPFEIVVTDRLVREDQHVVVEPGGPDCCDLIGG